MKIIENLSKNIKDYIKNNNDLIEITIFFVYAELILYLSSYSYIFMTFKDDKYIWSTYITYGTFALSFSGVLFLLNNTIAIILFNILKKLNIYKKKYYLYLLYQLNQYYIL